MAYKGHAAKKLTVTLPGPWDEKAVVTDLVTNAPVPAERKDGALVLTVDSRPMALYAYRVDPGMK